MFTSASPYKFFISYSSFNVEFARPLAERLMAEGHSVWFAEYCIHTDNQNEFQEIIDEGISLSENAILLINELYIDSPFCRDEADKLKDRLTKDRIFIFHVQNPFKFTKLPGESKKYSDLFAGKVDLSFEKDPLSFVDSVINYLYDKGTIPSLKLVSKPKLGEHVWVVREAAFQFDNSFWPVSIVSKFRPEIWHDTLDFSGLRRTEYHEFHCSEKDIQLKLDYRLLPFNKEILIERYMIREEHYDAAKNHDRKRLLNELKYFVEEFENIAFIENRRLDGKESLNSINQDFSTFKNYRAHIFVKVLTSKRLLHRMLTFYLPDNERIYRLYLISFLHPIFDNNPFVVRFVFAFPNNLKKFYESVFWSDTLVKSMQLTGNEIPTRICRRLNNG